MLFTPWLRSLKPSGCSKSRTRNRLRPKRRQQLLQTVVSTVESLEDRTLLAVGSMFVQATGTLIVVSDASDGIDITAAGGQVLVNGASPQTGPLAASSVLGISVTGGQGGNDIDLSGVTSADFTALSPVAIQVHGGDGADTITASPLGGDYNGGHGNDLLNGGVAGDTLDGDDGHDTINGMAGDDLLIGEDGNDVIDGGSGADTIHAGDGEDSVNGGLDDDSITGGNGSDTLSGDDGNDFLNGDDSEDTLDGGDGNDTLFGGAEADSLVGGDGDDQLTGNAGADSMQGGAGSDTLNGGVHNDLLSGGDDNDVVNGDDGADTVNGDAGDDTLDGGAGDDTIGGGTENDNISGGTGNDLIDGGLDDDVIFGNAGDDTIIGGGGSDMMDGGAGNDIVQSVPPSLSITDVTVPVEGDVGTTNAVFNVTLSVPSIIPVVVDFATADDSAMAGSDYVATSGTLVFQPGEVSKMIPVQVLGDTIDEPDETFFVNLSNPTGAAILDGQGVATIIDDDLPLPAITIGDTFLNPEGDTGMTTQVPVTVNLTAASAQVITVDFMTMDGSATAGSDYTAVNGTLTFPAGIVTQTIMVPVLGDDLNEGTETFFVNLSNPTNALIADGMATVSIIDDDGMAGGGLPDAICTPGLPSVGTTHTLTTGMGDGTVTIPNINAAGQFNSGIYDPVGMVMSADSIFESFVAIRFGTTGARTEITSNANMNGDPTEAMATFTFMGLDFEVCQTVQFTMDNMGQVTGSLLTQSYTITNPGMNQADFELVRYLDADLFFDGTLVDGGGRLITMAGDEILFETDAGGTGSTDTTFVGITGLRGTEPMTDRFEIDSFSGLRQRILAGNALDDMIFGDGDMDGFIDTGSEYDVTLGLRNLFSLAPGATETYTTHTIWGSGAPEDVQPPPIIPDISITDVTVTEGNAGTTNAIFDVNLSEPSNQVVTVDFATADSTAVAPLDYQAMNGTLSFMPGVTSQQIVVPVNGDTTFEPDEDFFVNLTNATNGNIADAQGVGTILNDDMDTIPPPMPMGNEDDTLIGGTGNDTLFGGTTDDLLVGGEGDDSLNGGAGDDTLRGQAGRDTLDGSEGNDLLEGGGGSDTVSGGLGNDTVLWEAGDGFDNVDGGLGFDEFDVNTGSHNDRITVSAVGDGRFQVHHRIPSDAVGEFVRSGMIELLSIDSNGGADRIIVEDLTGVQWLQQVTIDAGRGSDLVDASAQANPDITINVMAGAGADTVIGGAGDDVIDGNEGNDVLTGGDGNDTINGSAGVDKLFGSDGDDVLSGGDNRDFIHGEDGNDTLSGGNQNDDLFGGIGNDLLLGDAGDDSLLGEQGNDTADGGDGADTIDGGAGNDVLDGSAGVDSLRGGDGNDTARGGADGDTIAGGAGNDLLLGGNGSIVLLTDGDDFINGNSGSDTLLGENGNDSLLGGAGPDELDGGFGNDQVNGNAGNDSMRGGHGNDRMRGGAGNDTLNGGHGEDKLFGQDGNDGLSGHDGHDRINGGAGADTLHGGDGDDTLRGGAGLDLLIGHDGNDNLNGQGGDPDTLVGQDAFDILDDNGGLDVKDNDFVFFADWIDAA